MYFSKRHEVKGVQQVLVFASRAAMVAFNEAYKSRVALHGPAASTNGIGAVYKIRAGVNGGGTYSALVRCGVTGELIFESSRNYTSIRSALRDSWRQLRITINKSVFDAS